MLVAVLPPVMLAVDLAAEAMQVVAAAMEAVDTGKLN
jgi:hypothetical protein